MTLLSMYFYIEIDWAERVESLVAELAFEYLRLEGSVTPLWYEPTLTDSLIEYQGTCWPKNFGTSLVGRFGQCYWNRRFAIPGFWPNAHAPWKTGFSSFSHQVMSRGRSKFFNSRAPFLSALMTSLDGKNQFSMERAHLPKPGNSKPSISIMLGLVI